LASILSQVAFESRILRNEATHIGNLKQYYLIHGSVLFLSRYCTRTAYSNRICSIMSPPTSL